MVRLKYCDSKTGKWPIIAHSRKYTLRINLCRFESTAFEAHSSRVCQLALYNDLLISTGGEGFAKVWSMLPSNGSFELERSERLHDLAVVARGLLGPWLVTVGKSEVTKGTRVGSVAK